MVMIHLVGIAFLLLPLEVSSRYFNSPKTHLSDSRKVKCDALPYRSTYVEFGCFFAVMEKIDYSKAADQCSEILAGAKVATKVPSPIFDAMMIRKSDFHLGSDSPGAKYVICAYDNDYKCDSGQSLVSGRCIFRAARKMNFVDAENYCAEHGMELPAPTNDLDNRLVRDALIKDPAWVRKSIVGANGFKWRQASDFTKWTTCDRPEDNPRLYAGSQNILWSCSTDTASVIDRTGFWSNGGTQNLMEVICMKSGHNAFTNGDAPCKSYHELVISEESKTGILQAPVSVPLTRTNCYNSVRTKTRYDVIGKATVESQRGCEVLCDPRSECSGFAFKAAGLSSSCVLLSTETTTPQICSDPTTIFRKQTTGCAVRTDLAAEFGVDPCIDEILPSSFRGLNVGPICVQDNKTIIRAIDSAGRRVTLDNETPSYIVPADGMWRYSYHWPANGVWYTKHIVASVCATAGSEKCPCAPLKHIAIADSPNYAARPGLNPCNRTDAWLYYDQVKAPHVGPIYLPVSVSTDALVQCKAGSWIFWGHGNQMNNWAVNGLACFHY